MSRLRGPCEAVRVVRNIKGIVEMVRCGVEGRERRELRIDRAVGEILCDEHADAERARQQGW